ncbi:MAG: hypothetical protein AAF485_23500 [Chloroflexota bacterium]
MYTISVTRLRLRSVVYVPLFMFHAMRSGSQANESEGIHGFETRSEAGWVFWTKTSWSTEADMKQFRNSGAHQVAMRILSRICNEAAYVRWTQDSPDLPDWAEAHHRLTIEGRLSKLKRPSAFHLAGQAAPPLE